MSFLRNFCCYFRGFDKVANRNGKNFRRVGYENFFAMVGFEDAVNMAEETKDPVRIFPKILLAGLLLEMKPFPANGWALDVYETAPAGLGALMSAGVSAGLFHVRFRRGYLPRDSAATPVRAISTRPSGRISSA